MASVDDTALYHLINQLINHSINQSLSGLFHLLFPFILEECSCSYTTFILNITYVETTAKLPEVHLNSLIWRFYEILFHVNTGMCNRPTCVPHISTITDGYIFMTLIYMQLCSGRSYNVLLQISPAFLNYIPVSELDFQ